MAASRTTGCATTHHDSKEAASGAAQPNLSKAVILREVGFPELGIAEQVEVGQLLDAVEGTRDLLRQEARALRGVRSAISHALLSGEAEIPECYDALLEAV